MTNSSNLGGLSARASHLATWVQSGITVATSAYRSESAVGWASMFAERGYRISPALVKNFEAKGAFLPPSLLPAPVLGRVFGDRPLIQGTYVEQLAVSPFAPLSREEALALALGMRPPLGEAAIYFVHEEFVGVGSNTPLIIGLHRSQAGVPTVFVEQYHPGRPWKRGGRWVFSAREKTMSAT